MKASTRSAASTHAQRSGSGTAHWRLSGIVQGVGFRPFVYRLAHVHGLTGWVKNCTGQVEIIATGDVTQLDAFGHDLIKQAPPIAQPHIEAYEKLPFETFEAFQIRDSEASESADIHVPPDYFVCDQCRAEMNDPNDRRFQYPFINCTQCGPRYTLIEALPYDRANTSMAGFKLCAACQREYEDIGSRRFHAEPVACPDCGPGLVFHQDDRRIDNTRAALSACVRELQQGGIVAVKGVGGYHLLCDASDAGAVSRLRERKPRPHKPLALMIPEDNALEQVRVVVEISTEDAALLCSPERPVVLCRRRDEAIGDVIAPGLDEIGVMLPYSPLHHLLLTAFGSPLVATSANISGEPVLTEAHQVEKRLASVADAWLHHDRPIVRPADDSVYRTIAGKPRPLRLGRGVAPLELKLPVKLSQPLLAVGGHMKNTICLAWDDRAVVSPHIGDMGTARSLEVFEQLCDDLQRLYKVRAEALVCDKHQAYVTSRWARRQGLPVTEVQHHAAHASALIVEAGDWSAEHQLVFTWDGVGYGDDGTLWGGEALYGRPGNWQRVATLRPLRLPGGDKAAREPWRSAVAAAWDMDEEKVADRLIVAALGAEAKKLSPVLYQAWQKQLNAPLTSAAGRLFDAAAALTGVCLTASYEGQGPMQLEAVADGSVDPIAMPLVKRHDGVLEADWRPLFRHLMNVNEPLAQSAARFHESLAETLLQQVLEVSRQCPVEAVGLCGGVFQNRRLTEACVRHLEACGVQVILGERLPVNDAGLSFGQVMEFAACC